jgi:hypothetical protein
MPFQIWTKISPFLAGEGVVIVMFLVVLSRTSGIPLFSFVGPQTLIFLCSKFYTTLHWYKDYHDKWGG